MVKNLLAMQETQVPSLSLEDPLEKEMATHFSILAQRILWTEEPGRLYSPWGCQESDTTKQLKLSLFTLLTGKFNLFTFILSMDIYGQNAWILLPYAFYLAYFSVPYYSFQDSS